MMFRALGITWGLLGALGCGESSPAISDASELDARPIDAAPDLVDVAIPVDAACTPPATTAGPEVVLASPFDGHYKVYDLGPVPGVPQPLGGSVVASSDPNTFLVAGSSEGANGAIYQIGVTRDACGHIIGWNGTATVRATTPYVDANLVYASPDLLLYTEWPQYHLSQLRTGSTTADRRTDLRTIGMMSNDSGPGGIGFVPGGLTAAGQLRLLTWAAGDWYHATTAPDGDLLAITGVERTTTLPNGPGGFAYVPAGSPGFTAQSLIVAEWSSDKVAVYDVDQQGDPQVATRREFFTSFPRPWAAYFEPVTGDYFFLSWGTSEDHVYVVQGFVPPPPIL